jgi:hypothetical protein
LQCTNARRQAARVVCEDTGIPLNDAMAMLDSDYASEAQTCGTDTDASESMKQRRTNAGLGQSAKKVVGPEWRSPDVSEGKDAFMLRNLPGYLVCRLSSMAVIQLFQETGYGHGT